MLFNDYYGEYLMGFGVMEDLRVKMIWVAMALLKSEISYHLRSFCFDERFWLISFLMGI